MTDPTAPRDSNRQALSPVDQAGERALLVGCGLAVLSFVLLFTATVVVAVWLEKPGPTYVRMPGDKTSVMVAAWTSAALALVCPAFVFGGRNWLLGATCFGLLVNGGILTWRSVSQQQRAAVVAAAVTERASFSVHTTDDEVREELREAGFTVAESATECDVRVVVVEGKQTANWYLAEGSTGTVFAVAGASADRLWLRRTGSNRVRTTTDPLSRGTRVVWVPESEVGPAKRVVTIQVDPELGLRVGQYLDVDDLLALDRRGCAYTFDVASAEFAVELGAPVVTRTKDNEVFQYLVYRPCTARSTITVRQPGLARAPHVIEFEAECDWPVLEGGSGATPQQRADNQATTRVREKMLAALRESVLDLLSTSP